VRAYRTALGRPWAAVPTSAFLAKKGVLRLHTSCADRGVNWVIGPHTHTHTPLHWRDATTRNARVNSREAIVDVLDAFLEGSSGRARKKRVSPRFCSEACLLEMGYCTRGHKKLPEYISRVITHDVAVVAMQERSVLSFTRAYIPCGTVRVWALRVRYSASFRSIRACERRIEIHRQSPRACAWFSHKEGAAACRGPQLWRPISQ